MSISPFIQRAYWKYFVLIVGILGLGWLGGTLTQSMPSVSEEKPIVKHRRPSTAHFFTTYRDPATNSIPLNIRGRELAHVRAMPQRIQRVGKALIDPVFDWREAGPSNLGGRTRALAVSITNPQMILAGGVTGGLWKSTDAGTSWRLVSDEHLSITTVVQDPRLGHTNVWYHAGGEFFGPPVLDARATAPFFGAGIYRSIDDGETWEQLPATEDLNPTRLDSPFDFVHRMVVSRTTGTIFVANNGTGIYRSDDEGVSFSLVLGKIGKHDLNEVAVGSDGRLLAMLSRIGSNSNQEPRPGVYTSSDDGQTWTNITPSTLATRHDRSLIAIAPSNPDIAHILSYIFVNTSNGREQVQFHRLQLSTGASEDRTKNLPNFPGTWAGFGPSIHTQFGYDMTLAIKPDDENFVVIGGTSLYRSRDAFATPASFRSLNETVIGGYNDFTTGAVVANHYVDQQSLFFNPDQPNELWSGNDGGVFVTRDIEAGQVAWEDKNNGYHVSQFYNIAISDEAGDGRIIGGLQDLGTQYLRDIRSEATGTGFTPAQRLTDGDGSFVYIGKRFVFAGIESGQIRRLRYLDTTQTNIQMHGRLIQPSQATNVQFIQRFAVDPNDERFMYYPAGNVLWRNRNLDVATRTTFWTKLENLRIPAGYIITAITISHNPAHILYLGASHPSRPPIIYQLNEAHTATTGLQDISIPGVPAGAYIHDIALSPDNADEFMVALSNYNIVGLYYSEDGGQGYVAVEGNLEGDDNLPGPSIRAVTILPTSQLGGKVNLYLVGTSAGLFSTTILDGRDTVWEREASDVVGHAVVESIVSRGADGRVAVGTHGRGVFVGDLDPASVVANEADTEVPAYIDLAQNYPNPFKQSTNISFTLTDAGQVTLTIYDLQGRKVQDLLIQESRQAGIHEATFETSNLADGAYLYRLSVAPYQDSKHIFTTSKLMTLRR